MSANKQFNWQVVGHQRILRLLEKSMAHDAVGHAYIFSGPRRLGKTAVAKQFARFLICRNYQNGQVVDRLGCQSCANCRQYDKGVYPDFYLLERAYDEKNDRRKQNISVSQVRELQERISKRSFGDSHKVILIPEAEALSAEAANSLLKTLEEPSGRTVIIMVVTHLEALLQTVVSRCQVLNFLPVSRDDIIDALLERGANRDQAREIAAVSHGHPTVALRYYDRPQAYVDFKSKVDEVITLLTSRASEQWHLIDRLTAKGVAKDDLIAWLNTLSSVARDVQLLRVGLPHAMANLFAADKLKHLAENGGGVVDFLTQVEQAKGLIRQNIHPKFVFENLLIK